MQIRVFRDLTFDMLSSWFQFVSTLILDMATPQNVEWMTSRICLIARWYVQLHTYLNDGHNIEDGPRHIWQWSLPLPNGPTELDNPSYHMGPADLADISTNHPLVMAGLNRCTPANNGHPYSKWLTLCANAIVVAIGASGGWCAMGVPQEKEPPIQWVSPVWQGFMAPIHCAHWSHWRVLTYVSSAIDRVRNSLCLVCERALHEMWEYTQCECARNVRVRPIWMCAKCQCAQCEMCIKCQSVCEPNVNVLVLLPFSWLFLHPSFQCAQCKCASVATFFCRLFLRPNFQSAPNVNVLVLPHFFAGYFCAQIFRVHPMWMHYCCIF